MKPKKNHQSVKNKTTLSFLIYILVFTLALPFGEGWAGAFAQTKIDSLLTLIKTSKEDTNKVNTLNDIAWEYTNTGNYPDAKKYADNALLLSKKTNFKKGEAKAYHNIGIIYYYQGNYPEALKNYFASLKINEEILNSLPNGEGQGGAKKGIAASYNNIGVIYKEQGNYPDALKNHFASLKIREAIGDKKGIASSYNNIGNIYYSQGNYPEALKNYFASLKLFEEIGDKNGIAMSFINLGLINTKLNKLNEAQQYLNNALALSKEIGAKEGIRESYSDLANLDSTKGNFKSAYQNHKLYIIYRDSIDNEETQKKTIQSQMTYDFEKKEIAMQAEQDKKDALAQKEKQQQQLILYFVMAGLLVVIAFLGFVFNRFKVTQKQKRMIELQKSIVEAHQKEIVDSINYAERIQRSFIATKQLLDENLNEYFVFFKPKDVVSGDFYWAAKLHNKQFALVTADSTGHGVPGAIMSLLNVTSLETAVKDGNTEPAAIFNSTRKTIIERLKKDGSAEGGKDGMDASLCVYDFKNKKLTIAAANNPVWIVRRNQPSFRKAEGQEDEAQIIEIKPDKMPIGKHDKDSISFTQQEYDLQKGDIIYTLTDGFPDQFGGTTGKKFMSKNLRELLAANAHLPMQEQKHLLETVFKNWIGNNEQVDDVLVIGIKI